MTIQQLQYIVFLEKYKTFTKAAEMSFVTQPTLTMQIKKLEDEVGLMLFDRSTTPVMPTPEGKEFLKKAKEILYAIEELRSSVDETKSDIAGTFKMGIIPTIAPYLLPLFLPKFLELYPTTRLEISEVTTQIMIESLKEGFLDFGIAATPLEEREIEEIKLYEEEFLLYSKDKKSDNRTIKFSEIDQERLLILEEGHCFREQVLTLCENRENLGTNFNFQYLGGSIEGLKKLVDRGLGETLIPQLSVNGKNTEMIYSFEGMIPVREVSLVHHRRYNQNQILNIINDTVIKCLPKEIKAGKMAKKIIKWR